VTRIKICGLTSLADAELATEAGAWALGVILWPGSVRACEPEQAELIARTLRRRAEVCGVYVNAPLDELTGQVDALGLTMVQLHGEEGPAYCDEVRRRTGAKVIKAARVGGAGDLQALEPFHTDFHLLDTHHDTLRGGTGESWDWRLIARRRSAVPLILSGGLTAVNVGEAIRATRPFAVDTASGTEREPGRKDPQLVGAFAQAVREAQAAEEALQ
jgi:phosphoribosylanthranilate isomerase